MKMMTKFMLGALVLLVAGYPQMAAAGNLGIAPIKSRITTVKTYADLGAEWWQWAVQAPAADHPLLDTTGENCRVGQQGAVWFLGGTFGSGDLNDPTQRYCDVPGGKAIFFPVINVAYFAFINDEPPKSRTADFVRATAEDTCDRNSIRDLSVMIDGVPVRNPGRYTTSAEQSPIFQAQAPTDNAVGVVDDPEAADPVNGPLFAEELVLSPAAHQGFYIYLKKPLAPGEHTIEWTATWDCPGFQTPDDPLPPVISENVVYYLNVLTGVAGEVQ